MRLLTFLIFAAFPLLARALTFQEVELTCPIGGEKFKTVLAGSGYISGRFLDLKPFGPVAAPWPLAKCPSNGFVMYQSKYSESELERLEQFVASPAYQEIQAANTNYYLAATLQRHVEEPQEKFAQTLLQATWEARGEQYNRYASEALEVYKALLSKPYSDKKKWMTDQMIAGELERRTRRFDDALKRFSDLKENISDDQFVEEIVELQLKLISEGKSNPQLIPAKKK